MGINIDQILSDNGVETNEKPEVVDEKPVEETIEKEESTTEETPEQVETTEDEPKQEEAPKDKEEPVEEAKVDAFPAEKFGNKYKDWDEINARLARADELEGQDPENPFKDDYIKKVVDAYNATGDLTPFFKAHATDWNKMSSEEVLKAKFQEKYKKLDPKHINRLWDKEKEKYNLDSDDDEAVETGLAVMEMDAEEVRAEKIEEQKGYLQPVKKEPDAPKYSPEQIRTSITKIPEVSDLLKNKTLSYKVGDEDFNLEVKDPEFIIDCLADEKNLMNTFIGKDGKPDIKRFVSMVNFARDEEGVRQAYIDYGKSLGTESVIDEDYKNTSFKKQPDESTKEKVPFKVGLAEAFMKKGALSRS